MTLRLLSPVALAVLVACAACGPPKSAPSADAGGGAKSSAPAAAVDPQVELAAAQQALAASPNDPEALFRLGLAWQKAGKPDSAAAAFEAVLEHDPKNVQALVHHGLVLEDLGRLGEAEAEYRRAIEMAPTDPLPLINLGSLLYFHQKKTYEAKTALAKALELDPRNPDAHFNLGVLFADANLYNEAKVEWEKVLAITQEGPAASLAKENLARIRGVVEGADSTQSHAGHQHP